MAESSIELVPLEIQKHPAVLNWARRKAKDPTQLVLDQNYHYSAMKKHGIDLHRGRPDISHLCILAALGTPLNQAGKLSCIVHTRENKLIRISPKARLPRNTDRFVALIEQLFERDTIPKNGPHLLTIEDSRLSGLVSDLHSDSVIALTTQGKPESMKSVASELVGKKAPVLLIGGFSRGHFSKETLALTNAAYRISPRGLDAWTVVSRAIYDYEQALSIDNV